MQLKLFVLQNQPVNPNILATENKIHVHQYLVFNQITSRTSSASMLMKGSETCKAHMLSIIGEMTGSIDNAAS